MEIQPRRKYGWYGQDLRFAIGTRWRIGFPDSDMIGEVIEYGVPDFVPDPNATLVHLRIVQKDLFPTGFEGYWREKQLYKE